MKKPICKLVISLSVILSFIFSVSSLVISPAYADGMMDGVFHETVDYLDDSSQTIAKMPAGLIIDQHYSANVGSYAARFILQSYEYLDDTLFLNTAGDSQPMMILGRLIKFGIEDVGFSTMMVADHEIFGHGARAREFGLPVVRYVVRPYSGLTAYYPFYFNQLSLNQQIAFAAGGIEATGVLARDIRHGWLQTGWIDERDAHLYLLTTLDQTSYVLNTKRQDIDPEGDDVLAYIDLVNRWYGKPVLSSSKLRTQIMFDFLDPFLYYSLYSTLVNYLIYGNQFMETPMIPVGEYGYLPGFRLALAPYGPEYHFKNYITGPDKNYIVTFRYGNIGGFHPLGAAVEVFPLCMADRLSVDARADLWVQPRMFTASAIDNRSKLGAALSFFGRYQVMDGFQFIGQLGYKTRGYMPGEFLDSAIIARIGFAICY